MVTAVIEGGAKGADSIAGEWADANNINRITFHADWAKDGNAAGVFRNRKMLNDGYPDVVLAFPGGKGTAHMAQISAKAGIPTYYVDVADGRWRMTDVRDATADEGWLLYNRATNPQESMEL